MGKQYMRRSLNNSNELLFFSTVWTLLWKASYSFWYLVVFRNSSPILLKDIQISFLDVGCILLHTALIMLSFRLKGAQYMTDSVSLWAQDHCHPVKWCCCQSDPLQMVLYVDPNLMVVFSVHDSNNFDKIPDTTDWMKLQTTTEPHWDLQIAADTYCCPDFFSTYWSLFEPKISNLNLSLLKTCCHLFSVQFLPNLVHISLFSVSYS